MALDSFSDDPAFKPSTLLCFLVVLSSTPSPCAVYSQLVCLCLVGIFKTLFFFLTVTVFNLLVLALNRPHRGSGQLLSSLILNNHHQAIMKLFLSLVGVKNFVKCCKTLQHTVSVHTHSYLGPVMLVPFASQANLNCYERTHSIQCVSVLRVK